MQPWSIGRKPPMNVKKLRSVGFTRVRKQCLQYNVGSYENWRGGALSMWGNHVSLGMYEGRKPGTRSFDLESIITWSNMDRIWYILSIVATSISLVEKGPSVLVENGLRYRLCNWYYEIETKSLDLRHRVKQPVPKALFSTRWRFHPYQSMLVKKYIKSGKIFHMKYMQLFHAYHPRPLVSRSSLTISPTKQL